MSYATQAQMIARFGEEDLIRLTDRADPPLDVIDSNVLSAAQADAKAIIDSYVATRYTIPLVATPLLLTQIECDLAWFILQRGRPTDDATARNKTALSMLRDISMGKVSLGPDALNTIPADAGGVLIAAAAPVFTPELLRDY